MTKNQKRLKFVETQQSKCHNDICIYWTAAK